MARYRQKVPHARVRYGRQQGCRCKLRGTNCRRRTSGLFRSTTIAARRTRSAAESQRQQGSRIRAEARLAGPDRPAHGRPAAARPRSCAGRACPSPASGAGRRASCEAGRRRAAARQDPPARHAAAAAGRSVERVVALTLRRAAGRDDALDRPGDGARRPASRLQLGAADLARARAAAAPGAHLQALQRPGVRRQARATWSGSTSTRRRHAVVLSVDEKIACVDGPRLARGWLSIFAAGCLQSCVRPRSRPTRTAGPDGFRGSGPQQILGLETLDFSRLPPIRRCNRPRHRSPSLASFRLAAPTYAAAAAW